MNSAWKVLIDFSTPVQLNSGWSYKGTQIQPSDIYKLSQSPDSLPTGIPCAGAPWPAPPPYPSEPACDVPFSAKPTSPPHRVTADHVPAALVRLSLAQARLFLVARVRTITFTRHTSVVPKFQRRCVCVCTCIHVFVVSKLPFYLLHSPALESRFSFKTAFCIS